MTLNFSTHTNNDKRYAKHEQRKRIELVEKQNTIFGAFTMEIKSAHLFKYSLKMQPIDRVSMKFNETYRQFITDSPPKHITQNIDSKYKTQKNQKMHVGQVETKHTEREKKVNFISVNGKCDKGRVGVYEPIGYNDMPFY